MATVEALVARLEALNSTLDSSQFLNTSTQLWKAAVDAHAVDAFDIDAGFTLLSGYLVFFMQAGFAMLSAGSVRAKNAKNIILLNLLDACFGCLAWYLLGWAFAYGDPQLDQATGTYPARGNPFIGNRYFVQAGLDRMSYVQWFFQFTFAATSATIVSGAVAERCKFECYVTYTLALVAFVYPVVAHWVWSPWGWLSALRTPATASSGYVLFAGSGVYDFAGDGPVHMVGGFASLAAAWVLGPRLGRFDAAGQPVDIPGHNAALTLLGVFLLWFGWYGFNPGSTAAIMNGRALISAAIATNTTVSAAAATVSTLFMAMLHTYLSIGVVVWDLIIAGNGALAGLVAITGPCAFVPTWAALVIGLVAGGVYYGSSRLILHRLRVDDPLDAIAVHAASSIWGLLACAAFAQSDLVQAWYGPFPGGAPGDRRAYGFIMGGDGSLLAAHCVYICVIAAWVLGLMTPFFLLLRRLGLMRVSPEVETQGLDISYHGSSSYPHDDKYGTLAPSGLSNAKEVVTVDMLHRILDEAMGSMERRLTPVRKLAEAAAGKGGAGSCGGPGAAPARAPSKVNKLRPLVDASGAAGAGAPTYSESSYGGSYAGGSHAGGSHAGGSHAGGGATSGNPSGSARYCNPSHHSNPSGGSRHRTLDSMQRAMQAAYSSPAEPAGGAATAAATGPAPAGGVAIEISADGSAHGSGSMPGSPAQAALPDLEAGLSPVLEQEAAPSAA
eukprot:scaffold2.g7406.t1